LSATTWRMRNNPQNRQQQMSHKKELSYPAFHCPHRKTVWPPWPRITDVVFWVVFWDWDWGTHLVYSGNYVMWNNAASFVHSSYAGPKAERHWVMNARH